MPEELQSQTGSAPRVGSGSLFGDALEPRDTCKSSSGLVGAGGVYELLETLGVNAKRVRGKSFWEVNEFELDWIYEEFCRATRSRLRELHPDCGGDGHQFGEFRAASQRLKNAFEKKGFGRDLTLHRALKDQERFESMRAARKSGPIFRHSSIQEIDLGLWHSGVFDSVVTVSDVFVLPKRGVGSVGFYRPDNAFEARRLFLSGHSTRQVAKLVGISKQTAGKVRKTIALLNGCECGLALGHRGWCSVRFAKSEKRQQFMTRWHQISVGGGGAEPVTESAAEQSGASSPNVPDQTLPH